MFFKKSFLALLSIPVLFAGCAHEKKTIKEDRTEEDMMQYAEDVLKPGPEDKVIELDGYYLKESNVILIDNAIFVIEGNTKIEREGDSIEIYHKKIFFDSNEYLRPLVLFAADSDGNKIIENNNINTIFNILSEIYTDYYIHPLPDINHIKRLTGLSQEDTLEDGDIYFFDENYRCFIRKQDLEKLVAYSKLWEGKITMNDITESDDYTAIDSEVNESVLGFVLYLADHLQGSVIGDCIIAPIEANSFGILSNTIYPK